MNPDEGRLVLEATLKHDCRCTLASAEQCGSFDFAVRIEFATCDGNDHR